MYSLNILLLLLVSIFTCSAQSPSIYSESQEEKQPYEEIQSEVEIQPVEEIQPEAGIRSELHGEDLIPFTYTYSEETKKFLEKLTKTFHVTVSGKIRMTICSLISSLKIKQPNSKFNLR